MDRIGNINNFSTLSLIEAAIFSKATSVEIKGQTYPVLSFKNGNVRGVDIKGVRYLQQNPASPSVYADLARKGSRIIWVLQEGTYIGRIQDGEVFSRTHYHTHHNLPS